jgi:hypothetical protein
MPRRRGHDQGPGKRSSGTQHEIVREGQPQHQRGKPPPQAEMQHDREQQRRTGQRSTRTARTATRRKASQRSEP